MTWERLARELDAWDALGRRATLWWRDDDACHDSPALQRLLGISSGHGVPVVIAAIPADADASLVRAIGDRDAVAIVQHGYAHHDHAPAGERSAELGQHRALELRIAELEQGHDALSHRFGERFTPVLVPPWNRIADDLLPRLPSVGIRGVSCFGPRTVAMPARGLLQVNTHVDLIAWRRDRVFIGVDAAIERLVGHLRARRTSAVDAAEPTGILTHHLAFTDAAWAFMAELGARTRDHRAAAWLGAGQVFEAPAATLTSSRSA